MNFLENDIIKLRALEPEDLELLYLWENDTTAWIAGNTKAPCSRFQLKQYLAQTTFDIYENNQLRLMIVNKSTNQTVGTVDLFDFDLHHSRLTVGFYVTSEFQGKGFATQSLKLTENYVFNFLKINQIYAQVAESNQSSRRLFESNGFELSGTLKNWIKTPDGFENILIYQKFK